MKIVESDLNLLMARALQGDQRAYAVLLDHCRYWLSRFFTRRIAPGRIDDLIQDTLISLHRKRSSYDPARPFLPWLSAIARYRWIDQLRREYKSSEDGWDGDFVAASEEEPVIARLSIDRLLGFLSPAQAEAIELVKIEGLSIAEAAIRTGQSEALVRVNIHRGLKKLAALVGRE